MQVKLYTRCKANESSTNSNNTYFTYSGELVVVEQCCLGFQEKNNTCVGNEIYLSMFIVLIHVFNFFVGMVIIFDVLSRLIIGKKGMQFEKKFREENP